MLAVDSSLVNVPFAMGIFALFVAVVSLLRLLSDREFYRLTAMKRYWGRKLGITLHFASSVALPLLFGVVFLAQGVVSFSAQQPAHGTFSRSFESFINVERQRALVIVAVVASADLLHWHEVNIAP